MCLFKPGTFQRNGSWVFFFLWSRLSQNVLMQSNFLQQSALITMKNHQMTNICQQFELSGKSLLTSAAKLGECCQHWFTSLKLWDECYGGKLEVMEQQWQINSYHVKLCLQVHSPSVQPQCAVLLHQIWQCGTILTMCCQCSLMPYLTLNNNNNNIHL